MSGQKSFVNALLLAVPVLLTGCSHQPSAPPAGTLAPRVITAPPLTSQSFSIENAQELAQKYPNSPTAAFKLAAAYYDQKQFTQAIPLFQKTIDRDPLFLSAYYGLAFSFNQTQQWAKCKDVWQSLYNVASQPSDRYQVLVGVGNVCLDEHAHTRDRTPLSEALEAYRRAAKIMPRNSDAFYGIGIVYARRDGIRLAKDYFDKALLHAKHPRDKAKALEALASCYWAMEKREESKRLLRDARKADPTYPATIIGSETNTR